MDDDVDYSDVNHDDLADDGDEPGPACPACGTEMSPDGVDTAEGLESCHRCPNCKLVIVI